MPLPEPLPLNSPSLSEQLRCRANQLRSKIVRANIKSQFARTAPELSDFRHATAGLVDEMDDDTLSERFQKTVPFTKYELYSPYVARFFEKPCRASRVVDLLAPGLPGFIAESGSTSGVGPKALPKYNQWAEIVTHAKSRAISGPLRRRTNAHVFWFVLDRMEVVDEDNSPVKTVYAGWGSVAIQRAIMSLDPEEDEPKMATFLFDHAAPYAAAFIKKWRSFLLIHALFAIGSRSIETMAMPFINSFVDMLHHLDMEFDTMIDCIANGTIPDLDGLTEVRHHLESNIFPDPERAEELRGLGRPASLPGWCGRVWPSLRSITATSSGSFALYVPLARSFLGPNVDILTHGYGSTETWVGLPYNPVELNQFKLSMGDIIEFLSIGKSDSISSIAQPWEVERGKRYEPILTTQDGLWRYRLGDVIEISGFDPTDGVPIFQFIERRNMVIRFPNFVITEKELRAAMSFLALAVVNWTATVDDRSVPATVLFFVELVSDQVPTNDLADAPDRVLDELSRGNNAIASAVAQDKFGRPALRLVRPGTFSDFVQLKLEENGDRTGHIKVPVILPRATYVTWFSDRVVSELGVES